LNTHTNHNKTNIINDNVSDRKEWFIFSYDGFFDYYLLSDSARFHLRVADELLTRGDTKAAANQVNLAGIQLSLLNMGSQVATINQTQAMEFVVGGSYRV
jgi:hypothetical protein